VSSRALVIAALALLIGVPLVFLVLALAPRPADPDTVRIPAALAPEGVSAHFVDDVPIFLVRNGVSLTAYIGYANHLPGEQIWWCPHQEVFVSPFHGEVFDRFGRVLEGPPMRDLDRVAATLAPEGDVLLDLERVSVGSTERAFAFQEPIHWSGEFCPDHVAP
jgi:Rieske Fe-S protein